MICVELRMTSMRSGVHIQGDDFMAVWQKGKDIKELSYLEQHSKAMLDEFTGGRALSWLRGRVPNEKAHRRIQERPS